MKVVKEYGRELKQRGYKTLLKSSSLLYEVISLSNEVNLQQLARGGLQQTRQAGH